MTFLKLFIWLKKKQGARPDIEKIFWRISNDSFCRIGNDNFLLAN